MITLEWHSYEEQLTVTAMLGASCGGIEAATPTYTNACHGDVRETLISLLSTEHSPTLVWNEEDSSNNHRVVQASVRSCGDRFCHSKVAPVQTGLIPRVSGAVANFLRPTAVNSSTLAYGSTMVLSRKP